MVLFFHRWGTPYLTRDFFHAMGSKMGDQVLLVVAEEGDELVAGALNIIGGDTLFGRLWGCHPKAYYPSLHFEACYYQVLIWFLEVFRFSFSVLNCIINPLLTLYVIIELSVNDAMLNTTVIISFKHDKLNYGPCSPISCGLCNQVCWLCWSSEFLNNKLCGPNYFWGILAPSFAVIFLAKDSQCHCM